jgi:hypothetical protein
MTNRASALLLLTAGALFAQVPFEQKGYVEFRAFGFPDTTYNDTAHFIGEAVIHYDVAFGLAPYWTLKGSTETRSDTHRQTEREFRLNIDDRGLQRPNFSIGRVSLEYKRGPVTLEAGKQLIRWGTTSILTPTDRFAPRDYLFVVDNDVLAVMAARLEYTHGKDRFELVAQPIFTPSRLPLLNQRWTLVPERFQHITVSDTVNRIPGGTQLGARWKRSSTRYEASLSFFDGFNYLPLIGRSINRRDIVSERTFPQMRMYGGDFAVPVRGLTFKAESAYFTSTTRFADEYVLYVMQVEQARPRWSWTAGYAGEAITQKRTLLNFAPDRALARSLLAKGRYELTKTRGIGAETSAGKNGTWLRTEYREKWNQRWSAAVSFTLLRGEPNDFFGQYRKNSFFNLSLRYSFE